MAKWRTEYWIYEDNNGEKEIEPYHGEEWQKVYKIIREYEATGKSATHGRPMGKPFKMVYDEDNGRDPYYENYRIVDGKIVWKTDDEWRWEEDQ